MLRGRSKASCTTARERILYHLTGLAHTATEEAFYNMGCHGLKTRDGASERGTVQKGVLLKGVLLGEAFPSGLCF